jgi:hypothetical protein
MNHGIRAMSVASLWSALGEAGGRNCPAVIRMGERELERRGERPNQKAAA